MYYVISTLAAILIGLSIGTLLGQYTHGKPLIVGAGIGNTSLLVGSGFSVVLGLVTLFTGSWLILAVGVFIFLYTQALQRGKTAHTQAA